MRWFVGSIEHSSWWTVEQQASFIVTIIRHASPMILYLWKRPCNIGKCKENLKDYYQKWVEEQAQILIDEAATASQPGNTLPTLLSVPLPAGTMISLMSCFPGPHCLDITVTSLRGSFPGCLWWTHLFLGWGQWYLSWNEAVHGRSLINDLCFPDDKTPLLGITLNTQ